jgi:hypothetical protein
MGNNEDERSAAYNRHIYFEFAKIVQNYNDTAHPEHDDIEFVPATIDELDGLELDMNGEKFDPLDEFNDFIVDLISAIQEYGSFEDIPDDYEFDAPDDVVIDIIFRDDQEKCDSQDCKLCNSEGQEKNYIIIHVFKKKDGPDIF